MKPFCLLVCLLLLSACAATPQSRQIIAQPLADLPKSVELVKTPFYPQEDYQCGPAALATVLDYQGAKTKLDILSREMYIPARQGSLQIELTAAARRHGMLPYKLAPQLRDLFAEVAAGNPVLVFQNLSFQWYPKWHYAVVMGYDSNKREIILRSGTTKRWVTSFEVFERTWQRTDFWALVIVPVGKIPVTAKSLPYLKTAYAFEEIGHTKLAHNAYQAATLQWPAVADTWLTLGNLSLQEKDLATTINAFKTAIRLQPTSLVSWNNMAYALHDAGCASQAKHALQCGLKISPTDKNLQDSLADLKSRSAIGNQNACVKITCN